MKISQIIKLVFFPWTFTTLYVGSAVMAGSAILGYAGSRQQAKASKGAGDSSLYLAELQAEASREQLAFAKEQWGLYTEKVMPLELEAMELGISAQELALQRGELDFELYQDYYAPVQKMMADTAMEGPDYDRYTGRAAAEVDKQFDVQRGMQQRGMERAGVRPDSGRYQDADRQMDMAQAATRAASVNDATNYAEDTAFNRQAVFLGRQPGASAPSQTSSMPGLNPSAVASIMGSANAGLGSAASTNANLAPMYGNNAANTMQAGINSAYNLYKMWPQQTNTAPTMNTTGNTSFGFGAVDFSSSNPWANPNVGGPRQFAHGGVVPPGYANGGMIPGPNGMRMAAGGRPGVDQIPATMNGMQPARINSGEVVIPADVVSRKGTEFFEKLVAQYHEDPQPRPIPGVGLQRRPN